MDEELRKELTELQREWLEHLRRWERRGGTLKAYAVSEGVDHRRLYRFRKLLVGKGMYREGEGKRPRFVRAQLQFQSGPATTCRIRFRNGCVVELIGEPRGEVFREILHTVNALS
jgi:hypothetical protein